jgi:enoyl-CoA hydratase/carnithine racemase
MFHRQEISMSLINTSRNQHVLEIEMNRPEKRNALTIGMYQLLEDAFTTGQQDNDIRVVLLRGQPLCFTAGNDLKDFLEDPPQDENAPVFGLMKILAGFPKPLICAVNGPAVGIGTTICLHADLIYCGASTRFQMPFVRLGLVPELASSYLLPLMVGHARAFELLALGEPFDAATAKELGLVNAVFDDEAYLSEARHKAVDLAGLPPEAVQQAKSLMKREFIDTSLQAIHEETRIFSRRLNSPEARRAMAEFFAK